MGEGCVFCKIAVGAARATVVDEAEAWLAIEPLNPHVPGHLLFMPRRHVRDATVEPALTGTVFAAASAYLGRELQSAGNILTSVGAAATQTVDHLHVHVIPRGTGDRLNADWPWDRDIREQVYCAHDNASLGPRCHGCRGCPAATAALTTSEPGQRGESA